MKHTSFDREPVCLPLMAAHGRSSRKRQILLNWKQIFQIKLFSSSTDLKGNTNQRRPFFGPRNTPWSVCGSVLQAHTPISKSLVDFKRSISESVSKEMQK